MRHIYNTRGTTGVTANVKNDSIALIREISKYAPTSDKRLALSHQFCHFVIREQKIVPEKIALQQHNVFEKEDFVPNVLSLR